MASRTQRSARTVRRTERLEAASPMQPRNSDQRNRVYVGNLSWDTTWQALKDHMKQAGEVVRADVLSEAGGRSKGCGVVEYRTASEARTAIEELHDTLLNGRQIFVREDRDAGPSGIVKVFVGNLATSVTWQELKDHMRQGGNVVHAAILTNPDGESKGCGIVDYATLHDARRAIRELNNTVLHGRTIFVREDRDRALPAEMASTRVYVGNLAWNVQWYELKDHMKQAGKVLHADILQEPSGRSKGCAIVEYATAEEAARAIEELNDTMLNDRMIFVREDRETAGGASPATGRQLFVGNLWFRTTWYVLKDYFKTIGEVEFVDIPTDAEGRSRGFGTVRYTNAEDAQRAIEELNGTELEGRVIEVREDKML